MPSTVDPLTTQHLERNRYFTGKAMAARDFAADPDYSLRVHRAHNRLCHGWGILDGLVVSAVSSTCVRVSPGVGLDRYGREVVRGTQPDVDMNPCSLPALLCIRYHEETTEPVPPVSVASASAPQSEYNRVRESAEPVWVADPTRWQKIVTNDWLNQSDDDLDLIPLAVVGNGGNGQPCAVESVRQSLFSPSRLTRISSVNWPHNGVAPLRDLVVGFERPLHATAHGVSPNTFLVHTAASQFADRTRLPCPDGRTPELDSTRKVITYPVPAVPVGHWVYVSLLCDFLTDENGLPVDGSHLGGQLPSGNGVPGGVFDSWFQTGATVTP
ncbi:hypothetical protein [Saccharopolyspora phatthalungensis]|uniref:Uncharacterized protein n=1 Tax=Saccharopolyspora phatthalungensis TaxID=664693 RepID=A0A840Q9C4_9PSEU|nr:hypothetical protein [Saccharopolyspora phatthalungensis]MBB5157046.1 hypothetical protein [Saccharopolyspora phatthalungensis]